MLQDVDSSSSTSAKKILIVDDASFMRVVLRDIIKGNGLASEIIEASDGVEGVKAYQAQKPDLVTMDVNMPKADGIQALRAIMKINPMAKVVMVTSVEQKAIIQDTMKLGARDYIVKPFDRSNVGLVLNKVLRQR
jgi:two-component system chemotaxis response regulator CheY